MITATSTTDSRRTLKAAAASKSEHDQLTSGRADQWPSHLDAVHPPDERGDDRRVRILRQQLVGVHEQRRRGGDDGGDSERQQPPGASADDAVDQDQPDAERRHLEQLQAVVVEPPPVDERCQHQRPAPRIGDRAEDRPGVDDAEAVVGDDVADVAVEQAARLAQVQREVVALGVPVAVQQHGRDGSTDDDGHEGERPADRSAVRSRSASRVDAGCDLRDHCSRPRRWIAARRSATLSALNIVRCQARASRASCSHASSSWAIAA